MPMTVATLARVTPAQATRAWSSMSPEQASLPSPPVAGCRPATTIPAIVSMEQAGWEGSIRPLA